MKIQERKFNNCKCCGQRNKMTQDEILGCDTCKKDITNSVRNPSQHEYAEALEITVFWGDKESSTSEATHMHFCSWACVFKKLKSLSRRKDINFMSLPYLSFGNHMKGQNPRDFMKGIKDAK